MRDLMVHEQFETEVLERMKSLKLLDPLVFGGGTMLRLCYDLNRYSLDLDFWFIKAIDNAGFHKKMKSFLSQDYMLSDAASKHFTLLYEFRSPKYPKHLKIEIRKETKACKWKETIAFSKQGSVQVLVKAMTLDQMMRNKIDALLNRGEIRDAFDMEFMLRKGVTIPASREELEGIMKKVQQFKGRDFSVTLGSLLEKETRDYYRKNGFEYLAGTIRKLLSAP